MIGEYSVNISAEGDVMKLAIVSNRDGLIIASAVCQAFFDGELSRPVEVKLVAVPRRDACGSSTDANRQIRSHIVDAPAFMETLKVEEQHLGLQRIHSSMYVELQGDKAILREHGCANEVDTDKLTKKAE